MADRVQLTVTIEQADAINAALDLYSRLAQGQVDELRHLVSVGIIPVRSESDQRSHMPPDHSICDRVGELTSQIRDALGFSGNAAYGIGHPHVALPGTRAYEIKKVLEKAVSEHRDPNPGFRGVNYDGLIVRYAEDPVPVATVVGCDQESDSTSRPNNPKIIKDAPEHRV